MTSLASTIAGAVYFALWSFMMGAVIGWPLALWAFRPPRCRDSWWLRAQLPELDPAWDDAYMGWWCDDVHELQEPPWTGPGIARDGFVYRWHPSGEPHLQFLLTVEMVESQDLQVW